MLRRLFACGVLSLISLTMPAALVSAENPFVRDKFTADPAPLVHDGRVYVYAGHDEAEPNTHYRMNEWLVYSSDDMKTWEDHGPILKVSDFKWAVRDAYAAHATEKDGKFYFYVSTEHDDSHRGKAIGVAVADSPTGPFKDARGTALVTADMTPIGRNHGWQDIDPAVFTDDDGTSYLFWGNENCFYVKLKDNMIELDGEIQEIKLPRFVEAPWIHKQGDLYYLSYAADFPEKTAYATSDSIEGPWTYRGLITGGAGNSNTIHQGIVEFNDQWYFFYHTAMLPGGDSYRRSVCVEYLYHNDDGSIERVMQTEEGTSLPPFDGGLLKHQFPQPKTDVKDGQAKASDGDNDGNTGGYLFATFTGEHSPMTEQVYFGLSDDGLTWTAPNGEKPTLVSDLGEKGVRDPFLLRGHDGKTFYLIATDLSINRNGDWGRAVRDGSHNIVVWTSTDLVNWTEPELHAVAPDDAGCTWAPQAIYDNENDHYLVYWASTTKRDDFDKHRIWAATTRDFKTFSEPFVYIEREKAIIDTDIVFDPTSKKYYRFSKNETTKAIDMESADSIMGDWTVNEDFTLKNLTGYEGPACFRLRNDDGTMSDRWCLLLDFYSRGQGYKAWITDDLAGGQFTPTDALEFPFRFRHGSVLPVSEAEMERLR